MLLSPVQTTMDIHQFWIYLTTELSGIFDTHGVCQAIGTETAKYSQSRTVLALCEPNGKYLDVWICSPDGKVTQDRWFGEILFIQELTDPGKIQLVEKSDQRPQAIFDSALWKLAENNLLAVPLPFPQKSKRQIVPEGILAFLDHSDEATLQIEQLNSLAVLFTSFLERSVLRYQHDRQLIEFTITSDISQELTSTLELNKIFSRVSDNIRRMLDVESLSLALIDKNTSNIVFIPELMGSMFLEIPPIVVQPGQGIAGWVAVNKKALIVNNVYEDERFYVGSDEQSGFVTRSILCVPLQEGDRVIGIMEAINKRNGEFTDHDRTLLEALSGPLTAAILNAELHADVVAEKRRFETMFESMAEGVLTIKPDGRISAANESLITLLGLKQNDLAGTPASKTIELKENDFHKFLNEVASHKRKQMADFPQLQCEIRKGNSYIPVLASGAAVRSETGELDEAIIVFSDLRQVREVERMRDDFFHAIVHELRTPLATILMYARLLLKGELQESEKSRRFLTNIERESDRLQSMVRQMLNLAKLEAKEIQRSYSMYNLNEMFEEMIPTLADSASEKGLIFVQRIEENLPIIYANPETIYLVFKNLIVNAIKFTLTGSVTIDARTKGDNIVVKVVDEGIGIPTHSLQNLFKRFFRAQTAVEKGIAGTGLGLYMVKEGVESHHGTIRVDSQEGEGTTFTVTLPIKANTKE